MLAYYINLARRTDRRAAMELRFRTIGLACERVEAVTPADLTPAQRERYCNAKAYRWQSEGELSCSLSHISAMRLLLATPDQYAAIFEDDALLSPALPSFLAVFDQARPEVDLLRLETDRDSLRIVATPQVTIADHGVHRIYSTGRGTAGYVVSRRAAERIIAGEEVLFSLTDQALFNPYERLAQELTMRQLDPALVMQEIIPCDTDKGTGVSDLEALRLARIRDNGRTLRRLPHNIIDFLDRDIRVAAIKAWHQYVGGAAKRVIPFKPD